MSALEEQLRESACYGDEDALTSLLQSGVNVNSANAMNGWTALHWACKRGHVKCKQLLISWGANTEILSSTGETPLSLEPKCKSSTSNCHVQDSNSNDSITNGENRNEFVPNYLKYPELNHKIQIERSNSNETEKLKSDQKDGIQFVNDTRISQQKKESSITLKLRLMKSVSDTDRHLKPANQEISDVKHRIKIPSNALYLFENDFIEIDVPLNELTIRGFISIALSELQLTNQDGVDPNTVYIRKLPNTRLRRDVEIARLNDFEEIEIALINNVDSLAEACSTRKRNCIEGIENNEN